MNVQLINHCIQTESNVLTSMPLQKWMDIWCKMKLLPIVNEVQGQMNERILPAFVELPCTQASQWAHLMFIAALNSWDSLEWVVTPPLNLYSFSQILHTTFSTIIFFVMKILPNWWLVIRHCYLILNCIELNLLMKSYVCSNDKWT